MPTQTIDTDAAEVTDEVLDSDEFACTACENVEHVDDMNAIDNDLYCTDCSLTCDDCGEPLLRQDAVDDDYCSECRAVCDSTWCSNVVLTEDLLPGGVCTECHFSCYGCGAIVDRDNMGYQDDWDSEYSYCENCSSYCAECGSWSVGSECNDEECGGYRSSGPIRNLMGYHHTSPQQWLGGPLPKYRGHVDGYYLGMELEITAYRGDANVIHNWSREALGTSIFECKEDSSVKGFEIVTQPMTPGYIREKFAPVMQGFFDTIEDEFGTVDNDEPNSHGLHVHISRTAFRDGKGNDSPTMLAAFCRIIAAEDGAHLERIARRGATGYCEKIEKPVSAALLSSSPGWNRRRQERARRVGQNAYRNMVAERGWEYVDTYRRNDEAENERWRAEQSASSGVRLQRGAINLHNEATVEIRAFKSTRKPENVIAALRLVSDVADYVRDLARNGKSLSAKTTTWGAFCRWIAVNDPEMFDVFVGLKSL